MLFPSQLAMSILSEPEDVQKRRMAEINKDLERAPVDADVIEQPNEQFRSVNRQKPLGDATKGDGGTAIAMNTNGLNGSLPLPAPGQAPSPPQPYQMDRSLGAPVDVAGQQDELRNNILSQIKANSVSSSPVPIYYGDNREMGIHYQRDMQRAGQANALLSALANYDQGNAQRQGAATNAITAPIEAQARLATAQAHQTQANTEKEFGDLRKNSVESKSPFGMPGDNPDQEITPVQAFERFQHPAYARVLSQITGPQDSNGKALDYTSARLKSLAASGLLDDPKLGRDVRLATKHYWGPRLASFAAGTPENILGYVGAPGVGQNDSAASEILKKYFPDIFQANAPAPRPPEPPPSPPDPNRPWYMRGLPPGFAEMLGH